jgi:hypothetical protein
MGCFIIRIERERDRGGRASHYLEHLVIVLALRWILVLDGRNTNRVCNAYHI